MSEFASEDGAGSYESGLVTLPDGRRIGIEAVARLAVIRPDAPSPGLPDLLGSLRGALPAGGSLSMPLRLAVSTVRAGLGVIEEGLGTGAERVTVEIVLSDGGVVVARMPPDLAATMERDRAVVRAALVRAAPAAVPSAMPSNVEEPEGTAASLTSIFRYEKRQGRLRRVSEPDGKG